MSAANPEPPGSGPLNGLATALGQAASGGIFDKLQNIYQTLPDTTCRRDGRCCSLLPPAAPAEMLAWLVHLSAQPGPRKGAEAARLVEHFLLNAAVRRPCPWALPRACAVYPRRFLACRAYGLWPAAVYDARRQAAARAQERTAEAWRGLGVDLPPEVLAPGPQYCQHVQKIKDGDKRPMGEKDLEIAEQGLDELVGGLPGLEIMRASGGDLSHLMALLTLGQGQCLQAKVEVTRALLEGRTPQAADALSRNMAIAFKTISAWTI